MLWFISDIQKYFASAYSPDSLFSTFLPFAIMYSFLSYFTFSNVFQADAKKLKLNTLGIKTFLTFIFQCYGVFKIVNTKSINYKFYSNIAATTPCLVHMLVCLRTNKHLSRIFIDFDKIDCELRNLKLIKTINQRKRCIRLIVSFCIINFTNLTLDLCHISGKPILVTISVILIDFAILQVPIVFLFFCDELCYRFKLLSSCFQHAISSGKYHLLEDIRLLHSRMLSLINLLSLCFGSRILNLMVYLSIRSIQILILVFFVAPSMYGFMQGKILLYFYIVHTTFTSAENLMKIVSILYIFNILFCY